eukprot:Colp12_sorted_trinity150504_noHs@8575
MKSVFSGSKEEFEDEPPSKRRCTPSGIDTLRSNYKEDGERSRQDNENGHVNLSEKPSNKPETLRISRLSSDQLSTSQNSSSSGSQSNNSHAGNVRSNGNTNRSGASECKKYENCTVCQKPALFLCSNCYKQWYCDRSCQLRDWERHKVVCLHEEPEDAVEEGGRRCAVCARSATCKCSLCMEEYYCDRSCQIKNWTKHRPICDAIVSQRSKEEQRVRKQMINQQRNPSHNGLEINEYQEENGSSTRTVSTEHGPRSRRASSDNLIVSDQN